MKDQIAAEAAREWAEYEGWPDSSDIAEMRKRFKSVIEKGIQAWLDEKAAACLPPPDESPPRSSLATHSSSYPHAGEIAAELYERLYLHHPARTKSERISAIKSAIEKATAESEGEQKATEAAYEMIAAENRQLREAHSLPAEVRASDQVVVVGCKITDVSSRVCEHGQKSCEIRHASEQGAERWETDGGTLITPSEIFKLGKYRAKALADAHNATLPPAQASEPPQSRGEQGADAAKARGLDLNHVDGFYYAMGYDAALSQRPTPYTADEHDKTCICMYCKPEIWPDDSEENKYRDLAAERWNQLEAAKEDTKLAQEIFEESAVESRLTKYVVVQITTSTWEKLQSRFAAMKREEA